MLCIFAMWQYPGVIHLQQTWRAWGASVSAAKYYNEENRESLAGCAFINIVQAGKAQTHARKDNKHTGGALTLTDDDDTPNHPHAHAHRLLCSVSQIGRAHV